jgi:hypothetical protein
MENIMPQQKPSKSDTAPNTSVSQTKTITLKTWQLIVALIVVALIAAGVAIIVSISVKGTPAAPSSASSTTQTTKKPTVNPETDQPKTSKRGMIIKHIGDKAALLSADDRTELASWTVTDITINAKCNGEFAEKSKNGHFISFDVSAKTSPNFEKNEGTPLLIGNNSGDWTYILKDGSQWSGNPGGNSYTCLAEKDAFPSNVVSGTTAKGKIMFDLPTTDGTLILQDGDGGWEYPLS